MSTQSQGIKVGEIQEWIITIPFDGGCLTWIRPESGKIAYAEDLNLQQYSERKGKKVRTVGNEELNRLHAEFWKQPFTVITEEQWENMLECLPPMKWHDLNKQWNVFFCSEAMSGQFHGCYLFDRVNSKYYSGMKSIYSSDAQILQDITNEIK